MFTLITCNESLPMNVGREKIKEVVSEKTAQTIRKIEQTPQEKFFLFFLGIVSVSALVLGYAQFQKTLRSPFYNEELRIKRAELREQFAPTAISVDEQRMAELQQKDSDGDGLSDYSEIYVYSTNPYLADTDGDGVSDKQEILSGMNPNCAEGTECAPSASLERPTMPAQPTASGASNTPVLGITDPSELQRISEQVLSGQVTLEQIGIQDPAFQQAINQLNQQTASATGAADLERQLMLAELTALTPAQIRAELRAMGMDEATLATFSDADLIALLQQSISEL